MSSQISVLIVEDEMIIAAKVSLHLEQLGYQVTGILPRGEEAVTHCRQSPPDLLLLDVNLKGLLDGVETARLLQKEGIDIPIIYLTANNDDETYQRARNTGPSAFLSKPFRKRELARAIDLALLHRQEGSITNTPAAMPEYTHLLSDRIFVRHKDQMIKLFLKDILYVEAERAYCKINTRQSEYLLSIALSRLEEQLTNDNFMRVHRSYLINLTQVDAIGDGHVVINERAIPVSRSYREVFTQKINLIR